ncbi:MAG: hypothetical protein ACI90V_011632, partial [Bacillariaceae sp.]
HYYLIDQSLFDYEINDFKSDNNRHRCYSHTNASVRRRRRRRRKKVFNWVHSLNFYPMLLIYFIR